MGVQKPAGQSERDVCPPFSTHTAGLFCVLRLRGRLCVFEALEATPTSEMNSLVLALLATFLVLASATTHFKEEVDGMKICGCEEEKTGENGKFF